jgi:hypothetical protein
MKAQREREVKEIVAELTQWHKDQMNGDGSDQEDYSSSD